MAEEPFALTIPAPPATEADYDTICAAVMETGRRRWFLAEYARRNRNADTLILLAALERIEALVRGGPVSPAAESLAPPLAEAMKPDGGDAGKSAFRHPAPENAIAAIRAAEEHLQDVAWRLRERQYDDTFCDEIDAGTQEIVAACAAIEDAAAHPMAVPIAEAENRIDAMPARTAPPDPQAEAFAAFALPDEFIPVSESSEATEELEIACGFGASSEEGERPPADQPIAAAQAAENALDQNELARAIEIEATPIVSLWQLEETSDTQPEAPPAEAEPDAAAPEPDVRQAEPAALTPTQDDADVVASAAVEPKTFETQPVEALAVEAQPVEAAAVETVRGSDMAPQPAADAPQDPAQEKIRHALSQATNVEPEPVHGGWLSSLLTRMARGEDGQDENGVKRYNETAAAPETIAPFPMAAASGPAQIEYVKAEPRAAIAPLPPIVPDPPAARRAADTVAAPEPESAAMDIKHHAVGEIQPDARAAGTADMPPEPVAALETTEAEDDPAGFLLEPLPAALTAGVAKPQAVANRAPEPQTAPRDPLAPIRALSEEEKIALFS